MKCPNCQKEISNDSEFCNYCGAQIKIKSDFDSQTKKGVSNKKRITLAAIISVAFIVGLSFFVYFFFFHKSYKYNAIDLARYLSSQIQISINIDDVTDNGTISDSSYGDMNITTWIDSGGTEFDKTSNKLISFSSNRYAKKYCSNSNNKNHTYRYGNIVLELSSEMDDKTISTYSDLMDKIDDLTEYDIKKEEVRPTSNDFEDFIYTFKKIINATKIYEFQEFTIDEVPSDGIYKNVYKLNQDNNFPYALLYVYFDEEKKITEIALISDDIKLQNADGTTDMIDNASYPIVVSCVLLALDSTIDYEQISDHLHDEDYEVTINDYFLDNSHNKDRNYYFTKITKKNS